MQETTVSTVTSTAINVKEPPMCNVIYMNDNETSMQFVIDSLISAFKYDETNAVRVTEKIHSNGFAVVAVLPYEIAEQKGIEVTVEARGNGYPLQIKLEEEK